MSDMPTAVLIGLVASGIALLYYVFWHTVAGLPAWARIPLRILPGLFIVAFAALYVVGGAIPPLQEATAPPGSSLDAPETQGAPQTLPSAEGKSGNDEARRDAEMAAEEARRAAESAAQAEAKRAMEEQLAREGERRARPKMAAKPPAAANGGTHAPAPSAPESSTLSPPPPRDEPSFSEYAAPNLEEKPAAEAPVEGRRGLEPPVATEQQVDWDVVPVFYGTDRAMEANPKRLVYGWERGRRLELGRALVTVPRHHQVPTIERPWVIRIPYFDVVVYEEAEDPKRHFTMKEIKALTREEFLSLVRERLALSQAFKDHAFVFIHGYNTSFDNAVYRTAQIAYDLKFDGAPFLYSWPSGGKVASYTYDRESAGQSRPYLREFLAMVMKETGAKSISIIAHSMGNQPLLEILKDLKNGAPEGLQISQVILAAPDVDRDNFENLAQTIKDLAKGVTLYAASNDRALIVSRSFNGGVPRAGDVPESGPVLLPGIDTIDVTAASTDSLGLNHSGYAENNKLINDIGALIQTGERPPEKRLPILEKIGTDKGSYWRYPSGP